MSIIKVKTGGITADAVTDALIADDVVGTEHLTAGEVDATALGADSVTAAKINDDIISGATALTAEPADTDEFLVSDAGTLKRIDYSLIKGGGITMADQWRLTTTTNQGSNATVSSNWERVDDSTWGGIGTGLTESSGIFSFNSTGIYLITAIGGFVIDDTDGAVEFNLETTADNSSYAVDAIGLAGNDASSGDAAGSATYSHLLDVSNTTNVKFKFSTGSMASGSYLQGNTNYTYTGFTVVRLGDT